MSEWRPAPGFEGHYEVSSDGRVRNARGHELSPYVDSVGYQTLRLRFNPGSGEPPVTRRVHSLVAGAFLGPRMAGMETRHLNGDPLDNRVENLAYGTRRENNLDAVAHGTNGNTRKTHCPQGHPYDDENTFRPPHNPRRRLCKRCLSDRQKRTQPWKKRRGVA